jgi:hypothetical protein
VNTVRTQASTSSPTNLISRFPSSCSHYHLKEQGLPSVGEGH